MVFNLFAAEEAAREHAGTVEDRLVRRRLCDDARGQANTIVAAAPVSARSVQPVHPVRSASLARRLRRYLGIPSLRAGYRYFAATRPNASGRLRTLENPASRSRCPAPFATRPPAPLSRLPV